MEPTKVEVLQQLSIGNRVAEEEVKELSRYFVETDQWRRLLAGDVDVVFGPKGAGKSALYTSLVARVDELFDRGIVVIAGEKPAGSPAFSQIVADPPTSEAEFVGLWKLYILGLLGEVLEEWGISGDDARRVRDELVATGLAPASGGLGGLVRRVREYVAGWFNPASIEGGVALGPDGIPVGVTGKITLREPSTPERKAGAVSADELIRVGANAIVATGYNVWIVFDRLDVAFAASRDLEANALRALFRVYLDLLDVRALSLKIFLRSDIWRAVTSQGFREASHITRDLTIEWSEASLLNLVVRRLVQNERLLEMFDLNAAAVLGDAAAQREFFKRLVPDQIDSGQNPKTFKWMLGRVADGTKDSAPRELIHLLTLTRDRQLAMLERGEAEPEGEILFSRQAFRDALPEVSRTRLEQTLYAEYPNLRDHIAALQGEKTNQSPSSLAEIWDVSEEEAREIAAELIEVGLFERRGDKYEPDYWVPFLYRPALHMVQGSAEASQPDSRQDSLPGV